MKKLIQLMVVLLMGGFVLSSCNSSLAVTKRRYTKGYFVHHNSGKHQTQKPVATSGKESQTVNRDVAADAQEFRATEFINRAEPEVAADQKEVITASAPQAKKYTAAEKKEIRNQAIELAVKHPVKAIKRVGELAKQDSGDKALSLLWVVVVVLLIVYLLGILLDWAGGGAWIHILGIIALVLLILWLLRIL